MENPTYFAVIPASVRYDDSLSPSAKLMYGEITALTHKTGYCFAKNDYFAELYKVSERSIRDWISQLEKSGHLIVENVDGTRQLFVDLSNKKAPFGRNLPQVWKKSSTVLEENFQEKTDFYKKEGSAEPEKECNAVLNSIVNNIFNNNTSYGKKEIASENESDNAEGGFPGERGELCSFGFPLPDGFSEDSREVGEGEYANVLLDPAGKIVKKSDITRLKNQYLLSLRGRNKPAVPRGIDKEIARVIYLFADLNPGHLLWFKNKTQKEAIQMLLAKENYEKIKEIVDIVKWSRGKYMAPIITSPYELLQKMPKLIAFYNKNYEHDA